MQHWWWWYSTWVFTASFGALNTSFTSIEAVEGGGFYKAFYDETQAPYCVGLSNVLFEKNLASDIAGTMYVALEVETLDSGIVLYEDCFKFDTMKLSNNSAFIADEVYLNVVGGLFQSTFMCTRSKCNSWWLWKISERCECKCRWKICWYTPSIT